MKNRLARLLSASLLLSILLSLTLFLVAGSLCHLARSVSGCHQCCQPSQAETQARLSSCGLFCCGGLPGALEVPHPPLLGLTIILPGLHDLSVCLAPTPPPPKSWLSAVTAQQGG